MKRRKKNIKWFTRLCCSVSKLMINFVYNFIFLFFFFFCSVKEKVFQYNCKSPQLDIKMSSTTLWVTSDQKPRATNFCLLLLYFQLFFWSLKFRSLNFRVILMRLHDSGALYAEKKKPNNSHTCSRSRAIFLTFICSC